MFGQISRYPIQLSVHPKSDPSAPQVRPQCTPSPSPAHPKSDPSAPQVQPQRTPSLTPVHPESDSSTPQVQPTFLVIVHPVEHDLWRPPVPCRHIACHGVRCLPTQSKVQDFYFTVLTDTNIAGLQVLRRWGEGRKEEGGRGREWRRKEGRGGREGGSRGKEEGGRQGEGREGEKEKGEREQGEREQGEREQGERKKRRELPNILTNASHFTSPVNVLLSPCEWCRPSECTRSKRE